MLQNLTGWLKIREQVPFRTRFILGMIPILAILGVWFLLTSGEAERRVISPTILPSPVEVWLSFPGLWFDKELSRSVVASTLRVVQGFLVGLLAAFPLGVLMGTFSKVRALFEPVSVIGAYLPIPALVPLTMSLFGIDELQKVMFLALAFFVFLLPSFVKAVSEVDNVYLQTAYTLGATRGQVMRHVLLGVSMPQLFQVMRLGFGVGWTYIILAEMVAAERGLGAIIIVAQRRGPREHIYWVLLVIVAIAYVTDKLWVKAGKLLFPHMSQR